MSRKEELIKELEQLQKRESEIREELMTNYKNFDTWRDYAKKEDYSWLVDEKKAPLIRKYFVDNEDYYWDKYSTLYLNDILDRMEDEYTSIPQKDIEGLKQELMDINFGSMEYDW